MASTTVVFRDDGWRQALGVSFGNYMVFPHQASLLCVDVFRLVLAIQEVFVQLNVTNVPIFSQKFFVCLDLYVEFRQIDWDAWRSTRDIKEFTELIAIMRRDWLFRRITSIPTQGYRVYFLRHVFRVFE